MAPSLAFGIFLSVIGIVALAFAFYALARGGRGQRGGIGPLSERDIHVIAGIRMSLIGLLCLGSGGYFLYSFFS